MDRVICVIIGIGLCLNGLSRAAYTDMAPSVMAGQGGVLTDTGSENLISPAVSQVFIHSAESVISLSTAAETTGEDEQALIFALAARELDNTNEDAIRLIVTLGQRWPDRDYSAPVLNWMLDPKGRALDDPVFPASLQYVLARIKTRQQKMQLIDTLIDRTKQGHPLQLSSLLTIKAGMAVQAMNQQSAQTCLAEAYNANKYNKTAFVQLVELAPDQIPPEMYFEHLRYVLRENPLDMETALAFAQYAERLELFSLACGDYAYCADLYRYLHPDDNLPAYIYLPWAISCYNNPKGHADVARIADEVRQSGRFDIFLEAIAGRAALAEGQEALANQIFDAAEQRALQVLQNASGTETAVEDTGTGGEKEAVLGPTQMAWYYSFVRPDKDKALDWANKAYFADPNSLAAKSIMSYALVMNDQLEWAKPFTGQNETQICQVAQALILINEDKQSEAVSLLQSAIVRDPSSFVAERAKAILQAQGQMYHPQIDTNALLSSLAGRFKTHIVPTFVPPDQMVSLQLEVRQKNISFGENINGVLSIVNHSQEPILVGDGGLLQGDIRIDAEVSGVMHRQISGIVSQPVFPSQLIEPGNAAVTSLQLNRGALRSLLLTHPQAVLDIDFTVYMDPTTKTSMKRDGEERVWTLDPVSVSVHRPGAVITTRSLNQQYNAIVYSDVTTRIQTGRLFMGLLKEQAVMEKEGAIYHYRYADWMPDRLRSAFTSQSGLLLFHAYEEWEAKTELLATMAGLKLDDALSGAVAAHLRNPAWPARLMALTVLAHSHGKGFSDVLQWTARYDTHALVRRMADTLYRTVMGNSNATEGTSP